MLKLLVFAILLASTPATGLLEKLFGVESSCYSGCQTNYAANADYLAACKGGCDFKLQNEDCATQCAALSKDVNIQSSCQVGCTLSQPTDAESGEKPAVAATDAPAKDKDSEAVPNDIPQPERLPSIILIRLRQRPSLDFPSLHMPPPEQFFSKDPAQFFNDIIKQFQEKASHIEQSVRQSFGENAKDLPKLPNFPTLSELTKSIPIVHLPGNIRADSSSESSEETNGKRPLIDQFKHAIRHQNEHAQPLKARIHQFFTDVRSEWNDLVRKQPKIPIWIFLGILLSSSAILWYMVMSLCRHTPSRNVLSIRAQELIFHPYEGDAYEKEKIQPDDQPYEVTESLPIKVKLSNI